jgi:hypothetical protein
MNTDLAQTSRHFSAQRVFLEPFTTRADFDQCPQFATVYIKVEPAPVTA